MTTIPLLWAAGAAPVFAGAMLALPLRMPVWRRLAIAGLGVAALAASSFALTEALGRPKPVSLELLHGQGDGDAELLGVKVVPDVEIFVWVQMPGDDGPRAFVLPWNADQAEQLQRAQREGQEGGTGAAMRMPWEATLDPDSPMAWSAPQPAMPEKQVQ